MAPAWEGWNKVQESILCLVASVQGSQDSAGKKALLACLEDAQEKHPSSQSQLHRTLLTLWGDTVCREGFVPVLGAVILSSAVFLSGPNAALLGSSVPVLAPCERSAGS